MKNKMMILVAVMVLIFGASVVTPALAQVYPYPGEPPLAELPSTLKPVGPAFLLPDFAITGVVKEFISSGSTGTYYRYYVTIQNYGGPCINCGVKVKANILYAYPDHTADHDSEYDIVTVPNGGEAVTTTFIINERKRSGYDYPSKFVVTFMADADQSFAELDEDNNSWACDDWIMECDGCVQDTCP